MPSLRRYWLRFAGDGVPACLEMGCGISAFTRDDALGFVLTMWPALNGGAVTVHLSEDIDLATLDQTLVAPKVGDLAKRGVWFPSSA